VLFEEFKKCGSGETKYQEALTATIMKLQSGVGEANGRAVILATKLGADPVASDHELVTVWEAIRGMKDDISSLGTAVETGQKEVRVLRHVLGPVQCAGCHGP
jgi:tetrahydromethanopterin S-methyltransferase subunit H